ncbi:MAG: hypothetical protein JXB05_11640 [Myxococcaceae bacterium]|nr:hypothetical protein [Myxococcaceae bacterium]
MGEILVMGAGLLGSHHLTLETVEAVASADVVYHLVTGMEAEQRLRQLNPRVFSLVGFYRDGDLDLEVYGRIVSFLLAQAMAGLRVAFVVMGHPSIYVAPTHLLLEHGPRYGIPVHILPALSSIDTILSWMPFDIANTGLQILDSNRLVSYGLVPMRNVPLLVFQVGCFGSGFITRQLQNAPDRLRPLVDYLLAYYPGEHPVELIECEMGWPHRAVRHRLTLAELATSGHLVNYNTTLFVPQAEPVSIRDPAFHARLVAPEAVSSLVQAPPTHGSQADNPGPAR